MKKLLLYVILAMLVSCDVGEDIVTPPIPEVKKFNVSVKSDTNGTVTPTFTTIDSGKNVSLSSDPKLGYERNTITINGVEKPLVVDPYLIENIESDKKVEITFKKDSILFPLLSYTWYEIKEESYLSGQWVIFKNPYPWTFNFFEDGSVIELWNGRLYDDVTWSVDKSTSPVTFKMFGQNWKIEIISETEMVLSRIPFESVPCRYTFKSGTKITLKI